MTSVKMKLHDLDYVLNIDYVVDAIYKNEQIVSIFIENQKLPYFSFVSLFNFCMV